MTYSWTKLVSALTVLTVTAVGLSSVDGSAAPSAEVAKRCIHYSYVVYPFKRPGAVPMSSDRQAYFKECMAKNGDVPNPEPRKQ